MTDIVDKETRSRMMSSIRGKDTKPEILVRKYLHKRGFRYRLHVKEMPGKPDLVFPKYNAVIQVHGCFWHRHEKCQYAYVPKSKTKFWGNKFQSNIDRDKRNEQRLLAGGWRLLIVWECALKGDRAKNNLNLIAKWIKSPSVRGVIP